MKLTFSAPVLLLTDEGPTYDLVRLAVFDGVASEECFSDYLSDNPATRQLLERWVSGGYLRFCFQADVGELWANTEYDLREPLTESEVTSLRDYTVGQWSDGIGENFCPECRVRFSVFPAIQWELHLLVTRLA